MMAPRTICVRHARHCIHDAFGLGGIAIVYRAHDVRLDGAVGVHEGPFTKPRRLAFRQLALDPMWQPLRSLPRYKRLMATASEQEIR